MNDLEQLLRDTVTDNRRRLDPPPAFYEGVRRRATQRRRRQLASGASVLAIVAVAAVGTTVAVQRPPHHERQVGGPSALSVDPLRGSVGASVALGGDKFQAPMDVVATPSGLYVLTTTVSKLDAAGSRVVATAPGTAGTPSGLAVDGNRLWVWSQDIGEVRLYDANSLQVLATFEAGLNFFSAAAIDGNLWLAANEGLYALPADATDWAAAKRVVNSPVYSVAADPARHRVLAGTMVAESGGDGLGGTSVIAVDTRDQRVTTVGTTMPVGKSSIAIVGNQVWVGGYGPGDSKRIEHLNGSTLTVIGSSPVADQVGPGAILWSGGKVLWVRNGGDEGLSCVNPMTGAILEHWDAVQGPVSSITGHAYAVVGNVVRLNLNAACTG
jgi:hypothetical protein